ncbi:MAG: hypothetical protein A3D24_02755 [Candidatus Blackburnbacteria bacterium RIFCSPHIGHO2_02_FULL_39_13]|uniref:Uncharacterized protein n=1 Tax=Candidatus Blackburnbacteria bacterium RIFCSPLOWO2_01_FULL_40_20 TaxID=1797519 RepID=A0A1G1VBG6_9BACT|nr:MAG: hypothetical protein A2694_01660 [Candidatus Blackburnbacteria bacterium RIFCSPHIGHO2_01_FULL_40_17]OGY07745.1 MAG: hypothetical protein A3D24_02755 [Candidatus Blackburnbacteria bacterium RIFCSPHIGHO2_02_FULL_39_13]OGY12804.1 MAG: hypothetical protein A3A77_02920 [Candidatus Blackburnbacteria bacterium RIFCSPLOWO2_01_FULL_40_20]
MPPHIDPRPPATPEEKAQRYEEAKPGIRRLFILTAFGAAGMIAIGGVNPASIALALLLFLIPGSLWLSLRLQP